MNVIELNIDFSIKKAPMKIEEILYKYYKEPDQDSSLYKARVKRVWRNQPKQIKTLNDTKNLVVYDVYSERKYFLFRNEENICVNGKGQFSCLIVTEEDYKNCEENIRLVIGRIKGFLKKEVNISINYDSSCKIYICNLEEIDIVSSKFYLRAKIEKQEFSKKFKGKIKILSIIFFCSIIFTFFCWRQIQEYTNSLVLAFEEQKKAIISSKISILINIFTGIYGTLIIESILLIYEFLKSLVEEQFILNLDYEITKNNVEEFGRKSNMQIVGENLGEDLDITTEI